MRPRQQPNHHLRKMALIARVFQPKAQTTGTIMVLLTLGAGLLSVPTAAAAAHPKRPALHNARVEISEGTAQFHRGQAHIAGARIALGQPWRGDVDADGRVEVLAQVSFTCVKLAKCGNAWGGYLAAWRWRAGRYRLVATAADVKGVTSLRVERGVIKLRGDVQTGPGRQDVERVSTSLRRHGRKLVTVEP